MDTHKIAEKVAAGLPSHLEDYKFTKNDPDNPNPKGNDRDGDGKKNEQKPDWAGKEKKGGTEVVRGVVAALTFDGDIRIYEANNAEEADGIKTALMDRADEFSNIVHGPNRKGMTVNELYSHFEERWAGCEKLPEGPMRDNCEKKKDKGDKNKNKVAREGRVARDEIPVEQWPDSIMEVARQLGYSYRDIKAVHNSALKGSYNVTLNDTSEAITSVQLKRAEKAGLGGILAKVESLLIKG